MSSVRELLVRGWADEGISELNLQLEMLDRCLFHTYEPCLPPGETFDRRFSSWLQNLPDGNDEAKKAMFRMASELFYIGPEEFIELYRFAYNGPIARWLIDEENINVAAPDARERLLKAVRETWFCPITDSMRINGFFHVNQVPNDNPHRPDWCSLREFGSECRIRQYACNHRFKRLVLLEDFIGGGSQVSKTVEFAGGFATGGGGLGKGDFHTLVVPLIICPEGVATLRTIAAASTAMTIEPVISVPTECLVSKDPVAGEPSSHLEFRRIAYETYKAVGDGKPPGNEVPYHPLGYPCCSPTGGLIVMYSNTPDNTLPMVHCSSGHWAPLFPRHRRV